MIVPITDIITSFLFTNLHFQFFLFILSPFYTVRRNMFSLMSCNMSWALHRCDQCDAYMLLLSFSILLSLFYCTCSVLFSIIPFSILSLLPTHWEIMCRCWNRLYMISISLDIILTWSSLCAKFAIIYVAWMHWIVLHPFSISVSFFIPFHFSI